MVKNKKNNDGFITIIVMMIAILAAIIWFAFSRVQHNVK